MAITLDGDPVDFISFNVRRERLGDAEQRVNQDEEFTTQKRQMMSFAATMIYDGTDAAKEIIKSIKNLGYGLDKIYELRVSYPEIEVEDVYSVSISSGNVTVTTGGLVELDFSMVLSNE